jgi:hypothetical protein
MHCCCCLTIIERSISSPAGTAFSRSGPTAWLYSVRVRCIESFLPWRASRGGSDRISRHDSRGGDQMSSDSAVVLTDECLSQRQSLLSKMSILFHHRHRERRQWWLQFQCSRAKWAESRRLRHVFQRLNAISAHHMATGESHLLFDMLMQCSLSKASHA